MGEPPESELGAGGLPPNRPPETTEEGESGTATIEDCVGLGKFSNILVRTLVLLPLGLGLRLPRPTGLPTTLVPRLAQIRLKLLAVTDRCSVSENTYDDTVMLKMGREREGT